jgi:polyphenol oxidase
MSALESALLRSAGFRHGFSVKPLDFARGNHVTAQAIAEADEAISLLLRLPARRIHRASQVHGARAVLAPCKDEEADALVAFDPETAVGVRTADCVPILLASTTAGSVAAVHAGWRGIVAGVIGATFALGSFDIAAIGPCIGACCFEIGADVAEKLSPHVVRRDEGRVFGDLRAAVRGQLGQHGVDPARIDDVQGCTKCDAVRFFSHRRDGEAAGRHLAVIATRS